MRARSLVVGLLALALPVAAIAGVTKLTQTLRRETAGLATLESLSDWIVRSEEDLEGAAFRSKQLAQQIKDAERRRAVIEERMGSRRQRVQLRVRGLYKMSRGGLLRLLLEAPDEERLSGRFSAASLILRRDVREISAFNAELGRLRSEQQKLEQARTALTRLTERLTQKRAELEDARNQQLAALHHLRYSRRLQQTLAGELDGHQRALLKRIGELGWKVRSAGGFAALKGTLPRPVGGAVTSIFGKTVEGGPTGRSSSGPSGRAAPGVSILRHGFTYRPSKYETVHVVADGLVRVAGPFEGYGRLVVVEHSDGYFSLYGFLGSTAVSEGQRVRRTDPVGRVGIDPLTGHSAAYFELRHGERALDPAIWLRR